MALAENLKAAEAAVKYVVGLKIRAMNRLDDRLDAAGGVEKVIGTDQGLRAVFSALDAGASRGGAFAKAGPAGVGVDKLRKRTVTPTSDVALKQNVNKILAVKFGNCEEQAQVAMCYILTTYPTVRPLDLLTFGNLNEGYDHVWVGIGLSPTWNKHVPDGRNSNPALKITKYSLREWGPDAVWCDPWQSRGVAFAISDLLKGSIRNLSASYKCHTTEAIEDGQPISMLRIN